jgi:D-glycero-D-manno-heptose 1,7-bisphosphate phosphatase
VQVSKRRAVFLDRDGTLIEERGFITREEDIAIIPGVPEALKLLRELGYVIAVVSNQSGVARGLLTEQRVSEINEEVFRRLEEHDARPDMFFYCPHHPEAETDTYRRVCDCRKPAPGMVRMAQILVDLDISDCVSVGDKLSDVVLCQALGGKGILVLTGYGRSEISKASEAGVQPDFVGESLSEAAEWIESHMSKRD